MPFDFNWHDDEHTIVRIDIHGNTTWGEYHQTIDKVIKEFQTATNRIDLIFNDPNSKMPSSSPMPHIKAAAQKLILYPNMGVIVVVSDRNTSTLIKMLVSIVYRIYGIDTRIIGEFVNTLEEAEKSITWERAKKISV